MKKKVKKYKELEKVLKQAGEIQEGTRRRESKPKKKVKTTQSVNKYSERPSSVASYRKRKPLK